VISFIPSFFRFVKRPLAIIFLITIGTDSHLTGLDGGSAAKTFVISMELY